MLDLTKNEDYLVYFHKKLRRIDAAELIPWETMKQWVCKKMQEVEFSREVYTDVLKMECLQDEQCKQDPDIETYMLGLLSKEVLIGNITRVWYDAFCIRAKRMYKH